MRKKGFTLVEIIAIILVIAIVLLIAIPAVAKHIKTGRDKINTSNESTLELAAREYFSEHRAQLPTFNEYSLVLGTVLRDLNYLPDDLKDGDGGSCDASYVVIENKNGEYIYHVCMNCKNYKTNGVFCDKKPGVPDECKDGGCQPTCFVAPKVTKDSTGKDITYKTGTWTNKDIVFGVVGEKNKTTNFPIKASRIYVDGKSVVQDMQKAGKGSLGTKPKVYNNDSGQTYFEYKFTQVGLFGMYGVSNAEKLIGARVLDVGPYYSDLCKYKIGTKIECDNNGCELIDECTGANCPNDDECTGTNCPNDDECKDTDTTCTPPTDECKPGEVCVDKTIPKCNITTNGTRLTITVSDDASGVKELRDPNGKKMTTNTYVADATGTYEFTVIDNAGNVGTCSYSNNAVTYLGNGGTYNTKSSQVYNVASGQKYTILQNIFTRTGYTFTGWNTKPDGKGIPYEEGIKITVHDDLTLYAQWEVNTLTITYYANGGTDSMKSREIPWTHEYKYGETPWSQAGLPNANGGTWNLTKTGYHATNKWLLNSTTGTAISADTTYAKVQDFARAIGYPIESKSQKVTLYAQYEPNTLTITYYANGGTDIMKTREIPWTHEYKYNETSFKDNGLPNANGGTWNLTKAGHRVTNEWLLNSTTGTAISADKTYATVQALAKALGYPIESQNRSISLYAKWAQCSAGTYSSAGATSCTQCPAGTYSSAGASSCTQCPAGKYSSAGSSSCSTCSAGYYSTSGSSSCSKCAAGKYSSAGSSSCSTCPAGTYSGAGSGSCTSCPSGQTSAAGSTSSSACYTNNSSSGSGSGSGSDSVCGSDYSKLCVRNTQDPNLCSDNTTINSKANSKCPGKGYKTKTANESGRVIVCYQCQ